MGVKEKKMNLSEAAEFMGICYRHAKRFAAELLMPIKFLQRDLPRVAFKDLQMMTSIRPE
jgi:hypothetical protein